MKKCYYTLLLLIVSLFSAQLMADDTQPKPELPIQEGIGTVDKMDSHGKQVYRFKPDNKDLRMVKFVPPQLGYRNKQLPEEYETILATAFAENKKIEFKCAIFDKGPGKVAIGKKIISLKLVE